MALPAAAERDTHHWLGHWLTRQLLRYVAGLDGRWVAVLGFGSAALSCAARDGSSAGAAASSTHG